MQNLQQPQEVNPLFIHARWSFGNDEKALGNYANHPAGEGKWGMPKDLQSPPQGAKMGAVGAVVYKTMPDQKMPTHTFGIEPTTPIRWHFSGHPSS